MEQTATALDIGALNEKIERESAFVDILTLEMNKVIVGQRHMVERLLIGLLGQGHILLEGVPGLAKTLAINTLSQAVQGSFSRIQFTPDSGIAYAFHPHRDTWYSAPMCQINWWMPVYPISNENCMAFHSRYWKNPVRNSSEIYNYEEWNKMNRFRAAEKIGRDDRPQPTPLETVEMDPDIRLVPPVGGIIVFSAAHLHSSVPNSSGRTRISIDFRTVNRSDAASLVGAPNIDSECTGSTMGDYLQCADLSNLPVDVTTQYDDGPPAPLFKN